MKGERGLPIITLGIVPKIPCQCIFMLSDPGVPRTFDNRVLSVILCAT